MYKNCLNSLQLIEDRSNGSKNAMRGVGNYSEIPNSSNGEQDQKSDVVIEKKLSE